MMEIPGVSWAPSTADEMNYYDRLFQIAGVSSVGKLTGQPVVNFLARSGLSFETLKQVWDIAGEAKRNYLRREDFYVAMRLIAMAQASPGKPISAERLKTECTVALPLPRMQGLPPPPTGSMSKGVARADDLAVAHEKTSSDPYAMSAEERSKYERLFPVYDSDRDGFLTGPETVDLFSKSGLPREHLRQIWELSDADGDCKLSSAEFCVGMHLIVCASKKGLPIPAALPRSLLVIDGNGSDSSVKPSQAWFSSPVTSVPQSQVAQPSHMVEFPSGTRPGNVPKVGVGDAFSDLAVDLPKTYPTSSQPESSTSALSLENFTQAGEGPLQISQPHETQDGVSLVPHTENAAFDGANQSSRQRDSGKQDFSNASKTLEEVTPMVSTIDGQVTEQLQAEKMFLATAVEAGKVEAAKSEQELRDTRAEVEALQAEVDQLRTQFQQQQHEAIKLRARVTEAAVERATLLAEIRTCKAVLDAQQVDAPETVQRLQMHRDSARDSTVEAPALKSHFEEIPGENAFLLREEAMIDGTRDALKNYSFSMQRGENFAGPDPPSHHPTVDENVSSSADQGADRLRISQLPQNIESKVETSPEPAMPARTPPPPPPASSKESMSMPNPVEDPFAEVVGKEDSDSVDIDPSAQAEGQLPKDSMPPPKAEEKDRSGFDAFPPVSDGFDSDPFAMNGFGGNVTGEAGAEDPFSATDAVFTNATVAAGDGFDAFPPSIGAQFDAFGQNL